MKSRGLDLAALVGAGRELLADRTLTRRQFGRLLSERFPGRNGGRLASTAELKLALAHPPPDSTWGTWGAPA